MKNAKKILALVLTVAIVLSTVLFGTVTVSAETADAMVIASTNSYGENSFGDDVLTVTTPYMYDGSLDENSEVPANRIKVGREDWGDETLVEVSGAKALENSISSNVSYKVSSTQNEGYKTTVPSYITNDELWWNIDDAKYLLLHIKLPEGSSGFRFHGFAGWNPDTSSWDWSITEQNLPYYYLGKNDAVWNYGGLTTDGTTSGYADLTLPQGFEGYIAVEKPAALTGGTQLYSLKIRFEKMGGEYGDFYFGGLYATADNIISNGQHITKAKLGTDGRVVSLADYESNISWSYHSWSSGTDDSTYEYVNGHHGYAADNAIKISSPTGKGLYADSVKPIVQIPVGRSLNGISHIMFYVEVPENIDNTNYTLRLYAADGGGIEILDNTTGTKTKYAYASTTLEYIGINDTVWSDCTSDGNSQFDSKILKPGFKGYIKLAVDNITNIPADRSNLTLYDLGIGINQYGGDYGDFYFGGVYMISQDADSQFVKFGADGEAKSITFGRVDAVMEAYTAMQTPLLVDEASLLPIEENTTDTAYVISQNCSYKQKGLYAEGSSWSLGLVNGWNAENSATMSYIESKSAPYKRAVKVSATDVEGFYAGSHHVWLRDTTTLVFQDTNMTQASYGGDAKYFMFYIETPETSNTTNNMVRLVQMAQDWGNAVKPAGCEYYTLETTGSDWVKSDSVIDGNGGISLPNGFKGYVLVDIKEQIENLIVEDNSHVKIADVVFSFGCFGGDYGDFVYGGMYAVRDFNQAINLVTNNVYWGASGFTSVPYEAEYMTSNRSKEIYIHGDVNMDFEVDIRDIVSLKKKIANNTDYYYADADLLLDGSVNSMDLNVFRKCMLGDLEIGSLLTADFTNVVAVETAINSISAASLETADDIDNANFLYTTLSSDEKNYMASSYTEKLASLNAELEASRPEMLGFTCKNNGAELQSLKIGTDCTVSAPAGYTVSGYGTVAILESDYDGSAPLTAETEGAAFTGYSASEVNGVMNATFAFTDKTQYIKDVLTRSYVEYTDGTNTYKVYNNIYTYADNTEDVCMKASLLEVANAKNVAVFAKTADNTLAV